jgi:hypothetical protein
MMHHYVLRAGLVAAMGFSFGCSGNGAPMSSVATAFNSTYASTRAPQPSGVYVASVHGVALYSGQKGDTQPECVLHAGTGVINGIGVDARHVLWVPEGTAGGNGDIVLFAPKCGQPLQTIVDGDGQAAAVMFDGSGNAYVENVSPPGNIDVYAAGHLSTPVTDLVDANAYHAYGQAVDGAGNVYMSYVPHPSQSSGAVAEFVGGQNPAVELGITTQGCAAALAIDAAGNLLVLQSPCVQGVKNLIDVYAPPFGPTTKIASIRLRGPSFWCSFGNGGTLLYCSDSTSGAVDVYGYRAAKPGRTSYLYSWGVTSGSGTIAGAAPDPPFIP